MSNPPYFTGSMFNGSSNNSFKDSTFVIKSDSIAAFDRLEKAASPSAFHSFVGRPEPGKCYPNTRVTLIEGLEKWITGAELPMALTNAGLDRKTERDERLRNRPIMWLRGGAGAGKSAVAQTFAERCEDLAHIVASFFFFSTDSTRNSANRLVASLAYQIARTDPEARAHIEAVVHQDPHVFDQDFKKQIVSLILNPVQMSTQALNTEGRQRQCVIIIDGLDECTGGEVQVGIVRAISDALHTGNPNPKIRPRFLICSRPEEPIKRVFRSAHLQSMYTSIDLSRDTNAQADIRTFLEGKLTEIKSTHPRADLIPASWPTDDDIFTLMGNSSGHFIYAQTVVRFISEDPRPVTALEAIVGLRALPQRVREPFAELDELYRHILLRALETSSINTIRHVLGFVIMGSPESESNSHPDITASFLGLEDGELDAFLSAVPSLVFVESRKGISFYHKSFGDFVRDEDRAGQFYIEDDAIYAHVWARCMDMAYRKPGPDRGVQKFLEDSAFQCHYRSDDFLAGEKAHSLLGITQRRDFLIFFDRSYSYDYSRAAWTHICFMYWIKLSRSTQNSGQLVGKATEVMIDIVKDLLLDADWKVPLIMCQKPRLKNLRHVLQWDGLNPCFARFLEYSCGLSWSDQSYLAHTEFFALKRLLEDNRIGVFCLTEERFAEACLFWMTHLTKTKKLFPSKMKKVLQNQRGLILNESARRRRAPFRWRRTKQTIRPHQTHGRLHFLRDPQMFDVRGPFNSTYIGLEHGLTNREIFFGSSSDLVLQKKSDITTAYEEEHSRRPSRSGDRKSTKLQGKKTTVRGYIKAREHSCGVFFLPLAKLAGRQFLTNIRARRRMKDLVKQDLVRRQEFRFILSRIPAMLKRACKSDAVAALRSKAFPPFARCFPKLTRRAQQAMEEYAARHSYASPYADTNCRYTAIPSGNEIAGPTAAPSGEILVVKARPPVFTSISTSGQKRRHRFLLHQANRLSQEFCHDPYCAIIISEKERVLNCASPDCHRKYHLSCQGMARVPLAEWFCDEECERDVTVRKRMRYKL